MKKLLMVMTVLGMGVSANATNHYNASRIQPKFDIPRQFVSSGETATFEWGCPISEVVEAVSSEAAMAQIGLACMEDVREAANAKPEVFDVINVSVILPDVIVKATAKGFKLEGTLFLETLVMKGNKEVQ